MLPDEVQLRRRFDATEPLTIGVEEEVLLLHASTHEPVPAADDVVAAGDDPRLVRELPDCQVELVTEPHRSPAGAIAELVELRRVAANAAGDLLPVAAAVHPRVSTSPISGAGRHEALASTHGELARRQLVGALQVHVALGDADRTLAVYNALRSHLPTVAGLAAAAPFQDGRDAGLASVRPVVCGLLPRQGIPPAIESWEAHLDDLRWGAGGAVPDPQTWWWEARPHLRHGTIEVRVPDAQGSIVEGAAVVALVHALIAHLAASFDEERPLPVHPTWRIAENRWRAMHGGVHGEQFDLETGEARPTRSVVAALIDEVEMWSADGLDGTRALLAAPGADRLRAVGPERATGLLVDAFLA